jgi:ankyrin repeat protein
VIDQGADVNVIDRMGRSALISACMNNQVDAVRLLLEHNANCNIQAKDSLTALMWACKNCNIECVRLLVLKNADVTILTNDGETCLDFTRDDSIKDLILKGNSNLIDQMLK